jgi:hypothetical protein
MLTWLMLMCLWARYCKLVHVTAGALVVMRGKEN